jgi:hypothetical protein
VPKLRPFAILRGLLIVVLAVAVREELPRLSVFPWRFEGPPNSMRNACGQLGRRVGNGPYLRYEVESGVLNPTS